MKGGMGEKGDLGLIGRPGNDGDRGRVGPQGRKGDRGDEGKSCCVYRPQAVSLHSFAQKPISMDKFSCSSFNPAMP